MFPKVPNNGSLAPTKGKKLVSHAFSTWLASFVLMAGTLVADNAHCFAPNSFHCANTAKVDDGFYP